MANPRMRLGEMLLKAGFVTELQLKTALAEQEKWGGKLGEILIRSQYVKEEVVVKALSRQLGLPEADVDRIDGPLHPNLITKLPYNVASDYQVLPIALQDSSKTLTVAMANPENMTALDELRKVTGCRIVPQIAGTAAIQRAIARLYASEDMGSAGTDESGFKMVDAQGRTLMKSLAEIEREAKEKGLAMPRAAPAAAAPARAAAASAPMDLLKQIEESQRKEIAALKAMVELLIEKGVFSRDEYLARVKR